MERIVMHQAEQALELGGFLLRDGDGIEILVLGTWLPGVLARDKRGWYLQTSSSIGLRLKTGLAARLRSLTPEQVPWLPKNSQASSKTFKNMKTLEQTPGRPVSSDRQSSFASRE